MLLDSLELAKYKANDTGIGIMQKDADRMTVAELHRWFHYHVTKWLQDQGAKP